MKFRLFLIILNPILFSNCNKINSEKINGIIPPANNQIIAPKLNVKTENVVIENGIYTPLYGKSSEKTKVNHFRMDKYPVTNSQYLQFVKAFPEWQKSKVKRIFADINYLKNWENDTILGSNISPNSPVTSISWFAAVAFCKALGKRLPTTDEWELVAMADEKNKDARKTLSYNQNILNWYEKKNTFQNNIGSTYQNVWGVWDMHGLVWEWVEDFNSILISSENRNSNTDTDLFCGSGSANATDLMNYAAFMRYAFRSSIKGRYCIQNLGFRCAQNMNP